MTEPTLERRSDSAEQWGPLQRHQLVLLVTACALATAWLLLHSVPASVLAIVVGCLGAATPLRRGETVGQWLVIVVRFALRSRWSTVTITLNGGVLTLRRKGSVTTSLLTLHHVGRLDLSGHDAVVTGHIRDVVGALSATSTGGHVTQLVTMSNEGAITMLSAPRASDLVGWTIGQTMPLLETTDGKRLVREGWRGVRTIDGVYCVGRVETFRPDGEQSLLELLQRTGTPSMLSVHYAVVPSSRAPRIVGRAVHRRGVDETATRALGFRRSAVADRTLARLALREAAVASGHALVRVAVYLVVRGETLAEARTGVARITAMANDDGTRVRWGNGRQTQWFLWSLPGGLQW